MTRLLLALVCVVGAVLLSGVQASAGEKVIVGWIPTVSPYEAAICGDSFSNATGYEVDWRKFESGPSVIAALASGEVPISFLGSTPAAAAISQGLEIDVFWVVSFIATGEALIARPEAGITGPQDLRGKTLATPFGSTSHYHLLVALKSFGIAPEEAKIVGMTPPQIAAAWTRGDIDGSYVWDPVLAKLKDQGGKVVVDSGQLADWGEAILNLFVVRKDWAKEHPEFMVAFVSKVAKMDADYRQNPSSWAADSEHAGCLESLMGVKPADVPRILETFVFPSLTEAVTPEWIGGSDGGRVARWLKLTAEFLKDQNKISNVLPDYGVGVTDRWAKEALKESSQ